MMSGPLFIPVRHAPKIRKHSQLMRQFTILVVLTALITSHAPAGKAESTWPYRLNTRMDAAFLLSGAGLAACGFAMNDRHDIAGIDIRDKNDIPSFDMFASSLYSDTPAVVSNITMTAALLLPVSVLLTGDVSLERGRRNHAVVLGVMYLETGMFVGGCTQIAKKAIGRYRPYTYNSDVSQSSRTARDASRSMWSGHTAMAFAGAVFAGTVISDLHPGSKTARTVRTAGLALGVTTAALRVASGRHFPSDVAAGAAAGSLAGWLIPRMHRNLAGERVSVEPVPVPGGIGVCMRW